MLLPQSITLFRADCRSRSAYRKAYREYCQHYGFKVRVCGGWLFFEYATDYQVWKSQK